MAGGAILTIFLLISAFLGMLVTKIDTFYHRSERFKAAQFKRNCEESKLLLARWFSEQNQTNIDNIILPTNLEEIPHFYELFKKTNLQKDIKFYVWNSQSEENLPPKEGLILRIVAPGNNKKIETTENDYHCKGDDICCDIVNNEIIKLATRTSVVSSSQFQLSQFNQSSKLYSYKEHLKDNFKENFLSGIRSGIRESMILAIGEENNIEEGIYDVSENIFDILLEKFWWPNNPEEDCYWVDPDAVGTYDDLSSCTKETPCNLTNLLEALIKQNRSACIILKPGDYGDVRVPYISGKPEENISIIFIGEKAEFVEGCEYLDKCAKMIRGLNYSKVFVGYVGVKIEQPKSYFPPAIGGLVYFMDRVYVIGNVEIYAEVGLITRSLIQGKLLASTSSEYFVLYRSQIDGEINFRGQYLRIFDSIINGRIYKNTTDTYDCEIINSEIGCVESHIFYDRNDRDNFKLKIYNSKITGRKCTKASGVYVEMGDFSSDESKIVLKNVTIGSPNKPLLNGFVYKISEKQRDKRISSENHHAEIQIENTSIYAIKGILLKVYRIRYSSQYDIHTKPIVLGPNIKIHYTISCYEFHPNFKNIDQDVLYSGLKCESL